MRNKRFFVSLIIVGCSAFLFPLTASANSSWHWISAARPFDLLPVIVIMTLLIEVLAVNYLAEVNDLKRVVPVVTLANLASFLVPYAWIGIDPANVYSLYTHDKGVFYAINYTADHSPVYTVSFVFLAITLLVETPLVFLFFRKKVSGKKKLILVIIAANVLTTALTFTAERLFCYGEW